MSLGNGQNLDVAASHNQRLQVDTTGNTDSSPRRIADENMTFDYENDIVLASTHREGFVSPATHKIPGRLEKETRYQGGDSPAIEESPEARLERLGRQRPEVFDSAWAEIGFVFSISMSQVLTV